MSAEPSKNDELVANQLRFDFQARGEPALNTMLAAPHEIKIDEGHKALNSPASGEGYTFYVALIAGLLATTCGVAWFILYQSALPVDLTSGLTGTRDFSPKAISSSLEQSSNSPPVTEIQNTDRLQLQDTIVREIARNTPAEASQKVNVSSASRTSVSTALLSRASKEPTVAPQRTPTPETRPTTIEGWTLREVVNGTAVIEGPNGVWNVTPGRTVPGIGRVDSIVRWGNRLVVATSRGLISTP
jgi:hypothetical protein